MLSFVFDGITSLSIRSIRLVIFAGFIISLLSILAFLFLYSIISRFTGNVTSGWIYIILFIWFLGGLQFVALGLVGEYIGKIYTKPKRTPRYISEKKYKINNLIDRNI